MVVVPSVREKRKFRDVSSLKRVCEQERRRRLVLHNAYSTAIQDARIVVTVILGVSTTLASWLTFYPTSQVYTADRSGAGILNGERRIARDVRW